MVTKVPQRIIASTGVTSGSYTNSNITVNESGQITSASSGTGGGASTDVPKISNLQVTNSSWTVLDDTAVDVVGGYVLLTGVNFVSGCLVYIGQTPANSVAFVSSTTVRVTVPAITAGTYPVYLVNPDGGVAIRVPGVTISASPAWQTASSLSDQYDATAISLQLLATDAASYAIASGSLPPGLTMDSSGLISGTVTGVTVDTTYTFTVTATDPQNQDSPRTFTLTITVSDPYFRLTTLLLTGNSGNNIVTDASTNNFPITVVGDSRASTFSPYLTGWSNYFDGSGDYLQGPSINFATSDFSIECWAYFNVITGDTNYRTIFSNYSGTGIIFGLFNNGTPYFQCSDGTNQNIGSTALQANTWYHLLATRRSGFLRLFVNGKLDFYSANNISIPNAAAYRVGMIPNASQTGYMNGYISNLRVFNGTVPAAYITNETTTNTQIFTPSTSPLDATGSVFTTCHANRLVDSSTNNLSITKGGDVRVVSFNPFNLTNTGTSGSMYFDGTGDYLTIPDNTAFALGSGDWTIECWAYVTSLTGVAQIFTSQIASNGADATLGFELGLSSAGYPKFASYINNSYVLVSGSTAITPNQWIHYAAVRTGNTISVFTNGSRVATSSVSGSCVDSSQIIVIGAGGAGTSVYVNGYISNIRFVKGNAVYDAAQTTIIVPTTSLTATANTSLLTLQNRQPPNNHTFQDSSSNNFLITRSGNASQGAFSPFSQSGWSVYLNGSSSLNVSLATAVGTSDFTFECWLCDTSSISGDVHVIGYNVSGGGLLRVSGTDINWDIYAAGTPLRYSVTRSINTWYHIAYSRQGTTGRLFYNGTLAASQTDSTNYSATSSFIIGSNPTTGQFYPGYVSNARIVIGRAVYTSAFTTPTTLLGTTTVGQNPPQGSETKLLTCQSNRFLDNSVAPVALTVRYGSPSVQASSPFAPTAVYSPTIHGGSAYFDGSGDYLTAPGNAAFNFGSGDFTIEAWIYPQGSGSRRFVDYANGTAADSNFSFFMTVTSGNVANGGVVIGSTVYGVNGTTTIANTWTHVALVRSGTGSGNLKLYVNGVAEGTAASLGSSAINTLTGTPYLSISSYYNGGGEFFNGYVSSARIVKGTAVYTANFTPPTAPLTAITNTSLLLNFTNAGVYDATSKNDLETVGNAQISNTTAKWGSTSIKFDGTGDYLTSNPATTDMYAFGSGDFTIEFWMYISVLGTNVPYDQRTTGGSGATSTLYITSSTLRYYVSGLDRITSSTLSTGQWYHVAVARSGTSTKMFINGTQAGSTYTDSTVYTNSSLRPFIGGDSNNPGANGFNGYIQDLRITRGYARYTSNFTPPTGSHRLK